MIDSQAQQAVRGMHFVWSMVEMQTFLVYAGYEGIYSLTSSDPSAG